MLFIALTEGTLDSMLLMLFCGIATIVAMEVGLRLLPKKSWTHGRSEAGGFGRPPESP
jgi:hypothetical protein